MTAQKPTPVARISINEAQELSRRPIFVDARSATALRRNPLQVPGAMHAPLQDLAKSAKRLPHGRVLVTYCT